MSRYKKSAGFTLIELLLAMAFLSILLIAISALIIQITNIYTKGITLKVVNQSGTVLVSKLRRSLNQSKPMDPATDILTSGPDRNSGRICTGINTYVWNVLPKLQGSNKVYANTYIGQPDNIDLRFVRVRDPSKQYCTKNVYGQTPQIPVSESTELLDGGDANLVVHDLLVKTHTAVGGQQISSVSLVLGTDNGDEVIADTNCKASTNRADEFCAVNVFEFTVRPGDIRGAE